MIVGKMAVERREKEGGGGGGGKNLSLVDVYDIAADIGKVRPEQKVTNYAAFLHCDCK